MFSPDVAECWIFSGLKMRESFVTTSATRAIAPLVTLRTRLLQSSHHPNLILPFVLRSLFGCLLILEKAQRRPAKRAEVLVGVTFSNATLVFAEGHIQLPMKAVLDSRVIADR